jgi:hypothetical protein
VLSKAIKRLVQKFNGMFFANRTLQLAGKSEIRIRSLVSNSYTPEALFRRMKKARGLSTLSLLVSRRLVWFRLCPFWLFPFRIVPTATINYVKREPWFDSCVSFTQHTPATSKISQAGQ